MLRVKTFFSIGQRAKTGIRSTSDQLTIQGYLDHDHIRVTAYNLVLEGTNHHAGMNHNRTVDCFVLLSSAHEWDMEVKGRTLSYLSTVVQTCLKTDTYTKWWPFFARRVGPVRPFDILGCILFRFGCMVVICKRYSSFIQKFFKKARPGASSISRLILYQDESFDAVKELKNGLDSPELAI